MHANTHTHKKKNPIAHRWVIDAGTQANIHIKASGTREPMVAPLSNALISSRLEDTGVFDIEHNRGRRFISFNKVR